PTGASMRLAMRMQPARRHGVAGEDGPGRGDSRDSGPTPRPWPRGISPRPRPTVGAVTHGQRSTGSGAVGSTVGAGAGVSPGANPSMSVGREPARERMNAPATIVVR